MIPVPQNIIDLRETIRKAGASEELAEAMEIMIVDLQRKNVPIRITCVYRSPDEQAKLYAMGRTAPGNIVTNAAPGKSKHNRQLNGKPASDAFDACPEIDHKPNWQKTGLALEAWGEMGRSAEKAGLIWGRHWKAAGYDWCHFEINRAVAPTTGSKK